MWHLYVTADARRVRSMCAPCREQAGGGGERVSRHDGVGKFEGGTSNLSDLRASASR